MIFVAIMIAVFLAIAARGAYFMAAERRQRLVSMPEAKRRALLDEEDLVAEHGHVNPALICPHCQQRGAVRTRQVDHKTGGISGGKAIAAFLTGGISLIATGLSTSERRTESWCGSCRSTWRF
jgi:hypothetical protein